MNFSQFPQYRRVGFDDKPLLLHMGIFDVYSILKDLGYLSVEPKMKYIAVRGKDLGNLRDTLAHLTLGCPADTKIHLRYMGLTGQHALVTLRY